MKRILGLVLLGVCACAPTKPRLVPMNSGPASPLMEARQQGQAVVKARRPLATCAETPKTSGSMSRPICDFARVNDTWQRHVGRRPGFAAVRCCLSEEGLTSDCSMILGPEGVDPDALEAAFNGLRCEPMMVDGKPVAQAFVFNYRSR